VARGTLRLAPLRNLRNSAVGGTPSPLRRERQTLLRKLSERACRIFKTKQLLSRDESRDAREMAESGAGYGFTHGPGKDRNPTRLTEIPGRKKLRTREKGKARNTARKIRTGEKSRPGIGSGLSKKGFGGHFEFREGKEKVKKRQNGTRRA